MLARLVTDLSHARAWLGGSLLDELAGRALAPPPELPSLEQAREQKGDELAVAREVALLHAHTKSLPARLRAVGAADRAPVLLEDGSRLSRADAERQLAQKEERRSFAPLRRAIARAEERGREDQEQAEHTFGEVLAEVLDGPAEQVVDLKSARAALEHLLRDLKDACVEARVALARAGRAGLEDPLGLARGLDLPDPAGFSEKATHRLGQALFAAAGESRRRPVTAMSAPRALAGLVVTTAKGPVRAARCPCATAARALALSEGASLAVAAALLDEGELSPGPEDQALLFGTALAFGAGAAVVRRAVLEEPPGEAERRARILAATRLVRTEAQARAALVLLDGEGGEALRDILSGVFQTDPPPSLLAELLAPPWPGLAHLRAPAAAAGAKALRTALGASVAVALRDRYDEAFPLVSPAYELFGDARQALVDGTIGTLELTGALADKERPGAALVQWTADLL